MKSIIVFLIILFVFILFIKKNKQQNSNFTKVKSSLDGKSYKIIKSKYEENDLKKADTLAKLNEKVSILINSLSISDERRQLLENAPLKIEERKDSKDIGYTLNKGDVVGLCIEDDENTLFFVLLHELAHIITKEYGHPKSFWDNFEFLIKQSIKIGIYNYKNYNKNPINYCKTDITYTPLKINNIVYE